MKGTVRAVTFTCVLFAVHAAKAANFTLSDSAIMSLDYNLSNSYGSPLTASVVSKQDIPGAGVQFDIHFTSTNWPDYIFYQVSDKKYGAGTLANYDVSAYSNFVLKFTLLSIDGTTTASQTLQAGSLIGPFKGFANAYHPDFTSLAGFYPSSVISTIAVTSATLSDIGFAVLLYPYAIPPYARWGAGPHDVTLLVQPAPGAVQIPEPSTIVLVCSGLALFGLRRR